MNKIPHNQPTLTHEDRLSVDESLASGWIAQGPAVELLESNFVQYFSGGAACALSSGTAALFLALRGLGAGHDSTVAVPTYACSALLNAVYMTGATPVPVDVMGDTFCLCPDALSRQAGYAEHVVAVHTYGAVADIQALRNGRRVIVEDCCQSIGGGTADTLLGKNGDASVFSFYATKVITGGQGGMVWSRNQSVVDNVRDYREFDCRDNYVPRFNFQMTDIQAAIINSQFSRLDQIRSRRQSIAEIYSESLPNGLSVQLGFEYGRQMVYRFVVLTPDMASRDALYEHMEKLGVGVSVPIQRFELLHRYLKLSPVDFPIAEQIVDKSLSIPIYPGLSDSQVAQISDALNKFQL